MARGYKIKVKKTGGGDDPKKKRSIEQQINAAGSDVANKLYGKYLGADGKIKPEYTDKERNKRKSAADKRDLDNYNNKRTPKKEELSKA